MAAQRASRLLPDSDDFLAKELHSGIRVLLRAWEYARRLDCEPEELAVAASELRGVGLMTPDLLWLTRNGWVESVKESLRNGRAGRTARISCASESRVVLTRTGAEILGNRTDARPDSCRASLDSATACTARRRESRAKPMWDPERRELWFERRLVKRYRVPAPNQERVLRGFEEAGWAQYIPNPFLPETGRDPSDRLRETIKSLNRNQAQPALRFHGDGNGEAILWEPLTR